MQLDTGIGPAAPRLQRRQAGPAPYPFSAMRSQGRCRHNRRRLAVGSRSPANGLILFHLGYIWGKLENRAKEIAFYQKAIASGYSRDDRLYFNLGMAFAAVNQISDAVNALEEAVAIGSDNADNYFGLGLVYRQAGRLVEALAVLNRAIELDPQHWEAREELVRTDLDLSRWEDARRHLAWLEKTDPDHPTVQQLRETLEQRRLGDHTLRDKHT
jgi:tetratricopeptide (TPR) repeat protein